MMRTDWLYCVFCKQVRDEKRSSCPIHYKDHPDLTAMLWRTGSRFPVVSNGLYGPAIREKVIERLAIAEADCNSDDLGFNDFYELAVSGQPGLDNLTDLELAQEFESGFCDFNHGCKEWVEYNSLVYGLRMWDLVRKTPATGGNRSMDGIIQKDESNGTS